MIAFCMFITVALCVLFYILEESTEQQRRQLENAQLDAAYDECMAYAQDKRGTFPSQHA